MSSPLYYTAVALTLSQWREGESWTAGVQVFGSNQITVTSLWALQHIKQNVVSLQPFITQPLQQSERNLPQTPAVSLHREKHACWLRNKPKSLMMSTNALMHLSNFRHRF